MNIISGTEFDYPPLGIVRLTVRYNSRHISARWKDGKVCLNVPYGVDEEDVSRALEQFTPQLNATRPEILYYDGQSFDFKGVVITIKKQNHTPNQIIAQARMPQSVVEVGSDFDFNKIDTSRAISNMMCRVAQRLAPNILLPRAREIAHALKKTPVGWTISNGHRVLGRCDSNGIIALSYILVFLPQHLRDYVVCHELAHLSEMNHSPRFHELCNKYCEGKERELINQLHAYRWPVYR
ncbi:MAG: M48 family metallopeptidase [Bacteroidales bacterium]|nr:M48 family metallopeptidase [Bacteroidales bacterium]